MQLHLHHVTAGRKFWHDVIVNRSDPIVEVMPFGNEHILLIEH